MDILSEIIEVSDQIIEVLDGTEFFNENHFIDRLSLKRALQIAMQRKWEQSEDILLSDTEFIEVCNEVSNNGIAETIEDLVDMGALNLSVNEDGEILYSANKDFKFED